MTKKLNKAFTLIELLIVAVIIMIMAAIVIVNLNGSRATARDARREADLKQMQTALEAYFDKSDSYPNGSITCSGTTVNFNNGISASSLGCDTVLQGFLNPIPSDPKGGTGYAYTYKSASGGAAYSIKITLEKTGDCQKGNGTYGSASSPTPYTNLFSGTGLCNQYP